MDEKYGPAPVPGIAEWGDLHLDLDVASSFDRFSGLTRMQALERLNRDFEKDFLDDFLFLPESVFSYYFPALIELALDMETQDSYSHQNFIRGIFILTKARMFEAPGALAQWWPSLGPALRRLADAQAAYGFDATIDENYGLTWASWDQTARPEDC
ncbi:hypothetical protein PMI14_03556 [Acidovorax sp. CF316]|uniref:hypothetical protein n=1 Tax=Acidovorax sp. CF316 TaxID=1144317 RepID=UPI00026BCFAF|nr:hypothetical protein [Acidovorax sp. CF316]EJE51760.1 hypothetical protein PMI14_03556 [Acidovorax sp. CF316]